MNLEKEELLQNIYARYIRGVGGEREVAKNMLMKILAKQNITLEEYENSLFDNKEEEFEFPFKNGEKTILRQAIATIGSEFYDRDDFWDRYSSYRYRKIISITTTKAIYYEIKHFVEMFVSEYKKEKKKQKKIFESAFYNKNDLFPKWTPDEKRKSRRKPLSMEELFAIEAMMGNMKEAQIRKPLEHKQ